MDTKSVLFLYNLYSLISGNILGRSVTSVPHYRWRVMQRRNFYDLKHLFSLMFETHIGITSQRNKWANTDPRTYLRWDQVPWSKHPMSTGHTRCNLAQFLDHECEVIRCQSQCAKNGLTIIMKNVRQHNNIMLSDIFHNIMAYVWFSFTYRIYVYFSPTIVVFSYNEISLFLNEENF
jgi:hypothetical protein